MSDSPKILKRVTDRTAPTLFKLYDECCRKTSFKPLPLFLYSQDGPVNAGNTPSGIYIHEALPDLLSDKEIKAVMLHEIGHRITNQAPTEPIGSSSALLGMGAPAAIVASLTRNSGEKNESPQAFSRRAFAGGALLAMLPSSAIFSGMGYKLAGNYNEDNADDFAKKYAPDPHSFISALQKMQKYNLERGFDRAPQGLLEKLDRYIDAHRNLEARSNRLRLSEVNQREK